jgi:hypothetical protein
MKKKKSLMLILSILLALQPFILANSSKAQIHFNSPSQNILVSENPLIKQAIGVGGEEQLITNFVKNSGFEETEPDGTPSDYYSDGDAFQYADTTYSGSTPSPYAGGYACYITAYGTEQFTANGQLYRALTDGSTRPYLVEDIDIDFWVYLVNNPDLFNGGTMYLSLYFYHQPSSTNWEIRYYFSTTWIPSDSGNNAYINASTPFLNWENFHRDVTLDFETAFGPANPLTYLNYMYIYVNSPDEATGAAELLVDDFSVENSTGYDFIDSNEGFETGNGLDWFGYNRGLSSIYQSTDNTEGSYSLNMTCTAPIYGLPAQTYIQKYFGSWNVPPMGYYVTDPGTLTIQFDWKYTEAIGIPGQYAYAYLNAENNTHEYRIYWMLGESTDSHIYSNSSSSSITRIYLLADGFGERDTWNTFQLDVYDLATEFNIVNIPYMFFNLIGYTGSDAGSTVQLLVDDFQIHAYPTGDPSFEQDWYYTAANPIPSWHTNVADPYASLTSDAHSGDNAANMTAYIGGTTANLYRFTYLPVTDNLYTDFWYKLESIESGANNYAMIDISFENGHNIHYIVGSGASYTPSNSSANVYIYVDNYNQTGEWFNLVRNINDDYEVYFGPGYKEIEIIQFHLHSQIDSVTSLLVDDVNFVLDSTGPQLVSHILLNTPTYYNDALLEIMAVDNLGRVSNVRVYYRTDVSWSFVTATPMGMYFHADIPAFDWGNVVEYYVQMWDMYGNTNIADNSGSYYSYSIFDNIAPNVQITNVNTSSKLGIESLEIEASDIGSDIAYILIYDTGELIGNLTEDPFNFYYDPEMKQVDGQRHIIAEAFDYAGNSEIAEVILGVNLPSGFVSFFQNWGTLIGAAIVGTAWGTVVLIRVFKKRRA